MILLPLLLQLVQAPTAAPAPFTITGRSVRVARGDTVAAAGAAIYLHRVSQSAQGVLDSTRSDAAGRFAFRATADSGDVLLVSARWGGVEYFAAPVSRGQAVEVIVVDTSSAVPVSVAARHVILGGPAPDGTRDVVDLLVLRNGTGMTRVTATGSRDASFTMLVPPLVANLRVGDADFSPDAFERHGDTLALYAPIPPGDRQFFLEYQVAPGARQLVLPLQPPSDTLSILAEESTLAMPAGMTRQGTEAMNGRRFARWAGRPAASRLEIRLPGGWRAPTWLLPVLVVLLAVPLLLVTRRALLPRDRA